MNGYGYWKKWATLMAFVMPAVTMLACTEEVGDIDRTQSNRVPKEAFAGVWYYVKTTADIPYSSAFTFQGETNFGAASKVVFDVQEKQIIAYPIVETVEDTESKYQKVQIRRYWEKDRRNEFIEVYVGQPVAAWAIESHFDIVRDYSAGTGEQSNVLNENTTDREWWLRDYVRVDWNAEQIRELGFVTGSVNSQSLHYVQEYEQDPLNPDAPEFEDDYIGIVNKYYAEPNIAGCNVWGLGLTDCNGATVKVRHSFKRALPNDDAEVRVYTNREHMEKFGYFLAERHAYDEYYGQTESGRDYKAQLWNLWEQSQTFEPYWNESGQPVACNTNVDCPIGSRCMAEQWFADGQCMVGTPIPYSERGLNPIIYHLNAGHPGISPVIPVVDEDGGAASYVGGKVVLNDKGRAHPLVIEAYDMADQWSRAFKETVAWLRYHDEAGGLRVQDKAQGAKSCATNSDCIGKNDKVMLQGVADSTAFVNVTCASSDDCGAGTICIDHAKVCGVPSTCADGAACPLGSKCDDNLECVDEDNKLVFKAQTQKTPKAYSFVVFDDGDDLAMVRLLDGVMPYDIPQTTWNANGLFRFVNASEGTKVGLRAVVKDAAQDGTDEILTIVDDVVGVQKDSKEDQLKDSGMVGSQYTDNRFPYYVLAPGKIRRFEVFQGTKVLATLNNVSSAGKQSSLLVFAGGDSLFHYPSTVTPKGVRVIHASKNHGALDFGVDSVLLGRSVEFGGNTAHQTALVAGVNNVVVLEGGARGDLTCFNDNGVGKCVGWPQIVDEAVEKRWNEIYQALPEMYVLCEPIYSGDDCTDEQLGNLKTFGDCRYSTRNDDGTISNPCKDKVPHPMRLKKIGDARYNHVYWVGEAQAASPLGYGPSSADPETGRTFYAAAYIYGASLVTYASYAQDLLELVNGTLDVSDVITGDYIKDYIDAQKVKHEDPTSLKSNYAGLSLSTSLSGDSAGNPLLGAVDIKSPTIDKILTELPSSHSIHSKQDFVNQVLLRPGLDLKMLPPHHPMYQSDGRQARLDKIRGTWIEDMLLTDEVKVGVSAGQIKPGMPLDQEWKNQMSVASIAGGDLLADEARRLHTLNKNGCIFMSEFVDGTLVGLAQELGCTPEKLAAGVVEVSDYVTAVDLIMDQRDSTGDETLPESHCLSGDALHHIVGARIFGGVLEHEVGHTVGLRHNFSGSGDVFNFFDEWYDLRQRDRVLCIDAGGCDYARGEVCVQDCQSDADCPSFAKCEEVGSSGTFACYDKRDSYNDLIGYCFGPAEIPLSQSDCTATGANPIPGGDIRAWENGSCVTRKYCTKDSNCGEGERCQEGYCANTSTNAFVESPAFKVSCSVDEDCGGEDYRCSTGDLDSTGNPTCLKASMKIVTRAEMPQVETENKRYEYQYSTVMDYGQKINSDIHGLGKYDYAAIKFGYGDLVEVLKDTTHINEFLEGAAVAQGSTAGQVSIYGWSGFWGGSIVHPFFFLNHVVGPESIKDANRTVVPYQQVKLDEIMQYDYLGRYSKLTYTEVPYEFCSDEYRGNGNCYYFDAGVDDLEVVQHSMDMLTYYYIFDAFKRERLGFMTNNSGASYMARILDRWLWPMRNAGVYNALYTFLFADYGFWRTFTKEPMSGLHYGGASALSFQYMLQLFGSPAPGSYVLDEETGAYEHISENLGVGGAGSVNLPVGVGKFPYTTFDPRFGYSMYQHPLFVGSWWEKLGVLTTLTDSSVSFLSDYVGEVLAVGVSSTIGYQSIYPREVSNFLSGVIADQWDYWSGVVQDDGNGGKEFIPRSVFRPADQAGMPLLKPSLVNNNLKTLSAIYALTWFPSGFDPSLTQSLAVTLKGNQSEFELADASPNDVVSFTDPVSGKIYMTVRPAYDPSRISGAYELIMRANELADEWAAAETNDDLTRAAEGLADVVEMLEVLRNLNEVYGNLAL